MILENINKKVVTILVLLMTLLGIKDIFYELFRKKSVFYEPHFTFDLSFSGVIYLIFSGLICLMLLFISIKTDQKNERIAFLAFAFSRLIIVFKPFFIKYLSIIYYDAIILILDIVVLYQVILFYKKVPEVKKEQDKKKISSSLLFILLFFISFFLTIFIVFLLAKLGISL